MYNNLMLTTFCTSHLQTPLGFLEVQGNEQGIASITFLEEHPSQMQDEDQLEQCVFQLREYFAGDRTTFDSLVLHFTATPFQQSVWDTLMQVPFGETISYGELAKRSGHEGAARAVGTAMNQNPLPIIIPCHRVLPSDNSLGEYAFGSKRKEWLLNHEKKQ